MVSKGMCRYVENEPATNMHKAKRKGKGLNVGRFREWFEHAKRRNIATDVELRSLVITCVVHDVHSGLA